MSRQTALFPPERPPAWGETKAEAYVRLKESGRDLVQDERVRLAIAYLQPCTRETLYEWLSEPRIPGLLPMKSSSVSRAVNTLIRTGKVRAIGKTQGRYGSNVEVLQLGVDERVKKKLGTRTLEQPRLPTMEVRRSSWSPGMTFVLGVLLGLALGLAVALLFAR